MAGELGNRDARAEAGPRPPSSAELPAGPQPVLEPALAERSGFTAELHEGQPPALEAELHDGLRPVVRSAELPDGPRPRRGAPEQTRARLIHTAAQTFNEVPYWETDSNQLAKAAGYSTGTFYRHFKDKREIFIAAYREWVVEEWSSIESRLSPALTPGESIDRAADALIEHHRRWRVFRGNLRALVTYDEELRELTQSLRLEQLEKIRMIRRLRGEAPRALERDAIHALMFERICDALADGDFRSLGCSAEQAQAEFRTMMRSYLFEP